MSSGWLPKHRQLFFQIFQEGPNDLFRKITVVDHHGMPGRERGSIEAKPCNRFRDLPRLAETACTFFGKERLRECRVSASP